jgi:TP901 family phage tail tape measure protein
MPPGADQTAVLSIIIRARNEATAALRSASADVSGLQATMVTAGRVMITTGAAMGVALAAGLAATVGPAMQFEQTMSGVGAVSEATAAQMQQLSTLALQLGKDTVFSASEAGQAIEELAKGGVGLSDILNGAAAATVNLAAAGQVSLPQAATIAANAMNIFSISGQQMAHVADMIAGAANASSLEVSDFAYSMQYAGAYARSAGLSFDELAVAIAEMGKQGITGSAAGTQLADFLARLQPRAGLALKTMEQLGLVTKQGGNAFIDASGRLKNLADIQQILQNATAGLTDAQRAHDLQLIFGMQGQQAANILLRAGAAGYNETAAAMGKVTAQGVANARLNNLAGDLNNISGSLATLRIRIGEAFGGGAGMPAFRAIAQGINGIVGSMIDWTKAHGPLLARLLPLVALITAGTAAALLFGGAFALLAVAMNPVTVALLGVTVAIGAVGTAWAMHWGTMRATLASAWAGIQPTLQTLRYIMGTLADDVRRGDWGAAWRDALAMGQAAISRFTDWLGSTALPAIRAHLGAWSAAFGTWATGLWSSTLQPALGVFANQVVGWIDTAATTLDQHTNQWAQAFADWLVPVTNGTPGRLDGFLAVAVQWVDTKGAPAFVHLGNALGAALLKGMFDILKNITIGTFMDFWQKVPTPRLGGIDLDWTHYLPGGAATQNTAQQRAAALQQVTQNTAQQRAAALQQVTQNTAALPPPTSGPTAEQLTTAAHAAVVALGITPPRPGGATTVALEMAGGQEGVLRRAATAALQDALAATARAGNPLTAAFQQQAAEQRVIAPTVGTSTTPSAGSTQLLGGGGTTVNITVSVGAGAVQVRSGPGATETTRDYGLKIGEKIADALAVFARAEQAVTPAARTALPGAR